VRHRPVGEGGCRDRLERQRAELTVTLVALHPLEQSVQIAPSALGRLQEAPQNAA